MYQGNSPTIGRFSKLDDISSGFNSIQTTFSLQVAGVAVYPVNAQNLLISLNGVIQEPGSAYTINGSNIVFSSGVSSGTSFFGVLLGSVLNIGVPSDNSVDASKLAQLTHLDFNTTASSAISTGRARWNDSDGTLEIGLKGGNVVLQLGQEQVKRIYNNTGSTIANGKVVYVTGSTGSRITVGLASNNSEGLSASTFGVATENISNLSEGFVTTFGVVRGIDTSPWLEGSILWLDSAAGSMTTTKPVAPAHGVQIGFVIKQSSTVGEIFVNIQSGYELDELHDVLISGKTASDVLQYDSVSGLWKNVQKGLGTDTVMTGWLTKDMGMIVLDKGTVSTGTVTFNYIDGSAQRLQVGGSVTLALSNFPPSGNLGVIQLELVNGGSSTVTWPTVNWIKKDGTFTASISTYLTDISRNALQTSGTDFVVLWSRNAGSTVYGKIM